MHTSKIQKNKSSNFHTSKSFFNKSGEGSFFSESKETHKPFFSAYPIQAKLTTGVMSENAKGKTKNKSGMPDSLKVGLEQLSGMDLSGVRVHTNSSKPAQISALACTQGQDIHLGPGQEKHLPHEGWHVVQQMQGLVKPTMQTKGVPINDDAGLEREADVMGAKALQISGTEKATAGSVQQGSISLQRVMETMKTKPAVQPIQRKERNRKEVDQKIEKVRKRYAQVTAKINKLDKGREYAPESRQYEQLVRKQAELDREWMRLLDLRGEDKRISLSERAKEKTYLNVERTLPQLFSIEELLELYATNRTTTRKNYCVTDDSCSTYEYTKDWIRGKGKGREEIEAEISSALWGLPEKERIRLLNYVDQLKDSDTSQSNWLRDKLTSGMSLSYKERKELIETTRGRLSRAYTTFTTASIRKQSAIKSEIKAKADMLALFLDVFMVFGASAIAKGIANLANKLPVDASNAQYTIALAGLDENRSKGIFSAATKISKASIKNKAQSLFGESDTDKFLAGLRGLFHQENQNLAENIIPTLTNEELGVVAASFDATVANEEEYIAQISEKLNLYKKNVKAIGRPSRNTAALSFVGGHKGTPGNRWRGAYILEVKGEKKLALLDIIKGQGMGDPSMNRFLQYETPISIRFIQWIPPEMEKMAATRMKSIWGLDEIPTIPLSHLNRKYNVRDW